MKKLIVQEDRYYYGVIVIIGLFLLYNTSVTITSMNPIGLLPIVIQTILLFLLISKNQYSKIATKIWAGVSLIGAAGLKIFGIALQGLGKSIKEENGMELITSQKMIYSVILLIIGAILFILIRDMGIIGVIDQEKKRNDIKEEAGS